MTTGFNKSSLSIGLYIVVILSVVFFGLLPAIRSLKGNEDKLAKKQTELNQTYQKIETLQKDSKHPEEFSKISETVNNYWPDNLNVSQFIVQTEEMAKNNGLIIENFSVEEPKTVKPAPTSNKTDSASKTAKKAPDGAQFTFTSKTTYNVVLNLIKSMENIARFNTVSMINLSGDQDGQIDMRLTGKIYYGK